MSQFLSQTCVNHRCQQASSPACTELEVVVLDWLGKMLHLPEAFLHCGGGSGGGVIQVTS